MAAGRPIVASDLPAIREVLTPDENARARDARGRSGARGGIRRVVDDPALARTAGTRGGERVRRLHLGPARRAARGALADVAAGAR